MELFEEMERLKLKFIASFRRLCEQGEITETQFEEILDIIDRLDEYRPDELRHKLISLLPAAEKNNLPHSWQTNQKPDGVDDNESGS